LDPGWKKLRSGIRDKHPGSATPLPALLLVLGIPYVARSPAVAGVPAVAGDPAVAGFPAVADFPLLLVLLLSVHMTLYQRISVSD
jgi:hypothetical protein